MSAAIGGEWPTGVRTPSFRRITAAWLVSTVGDGVRMAAYHALFVRLRDRRDDYLRFVTDPAVPFDNNSAEQTIRMPKLRIKVSGSMRTMTGAEHFAAIRSYIATAARQGIDTLDALIQAATGEPWTPA
jgi:hypothetical protein